MTNKKPTIYTFHIDLNERGIFRAHVDNTRGNTVFTISVEPDNEDEFILEDMGMKYPEDVAGLECHLKELGIMKPDYKLVMD